MISIIIPVYNAERWLSRSIDSVIRQSYRDWELILVDDGSIDSSWRICQGYSTSDARIHCFHKGNGGVSSARNMGLEHANGDCLTFIDADDMLHDADSLRYMVSKADGVDMFVGGFTYYKQDVSSEHGGGKNMGINKLLNKKKFAKAMLGYSYGYLGYVWGKLYSTAIIKAHQLKFDESLFFCEDQLFVTQYICCREVRLFRLDYRQPVYAYYQHGDSAMGTLSKGYNPKFITDFIAYGKIRDAWKSLHNRQINNASAYSYYRSGNNLLWMMVRNEVDYPEQKVLINDGLSKLAEDTDIKRLANKYNFETQIIAFKSTIADKPTREKVKNINEWLHSEECRFSVLNWKWKVLFVLSHCFGQLGVGLIAKKISF